MISGAMFLYFNKPIEITSPPLVITHESFELLDILKKKQPVWNNIFYKTFNAWQYQLNASMSVNQLLEPLENVKRIWAVYPATIEDLERSDKLIKSQNLSFEKVYPYIDPMNASGEIIRHIFLEMYLSLNKDIDSLYKYCEELFTKQSIEELLVKGYLLRLNFLENVKNHPILLTNEPIWNTLFDKTDEPKDEIDDNSILDIISWEIFRQIISPVLDPLNSKKINYIKLLLDKRQSQIKRLQHKCNLLAERIKHPESLQ